MLILTIWGVSLPLCLALCALTHVPMKDGALAGLVFGPGGLLLVALAARRRGKLSRGQ